MLDLDFSEEQDMLRAAVRGVCESACPLSRVRDLEDDPVGFDHDFWKQLASMDLIGLALPVEHGGSGMSALEVLVLYEELGRSLAPVPHLTSALLTGGALSLAGSTEQQELLAGIASGSQVVTTAWLEPGGSFRPSGVRARAFPQKDGFVIDGIKWHVPFAAAADQILVLARTGESVDHIDLFLVDASAPGVKLRQMYTLAGDTQYEVRFDEVAVPPDARIGEAGRGWATWHEVMHDAAIALAAQACGGAQRALELATEYALDRHQFGKPLGAFQAIAHYLADAKTSVDGATTLVREAAWARATGRDVSRLAPMAKLFACQTFRDTTATAQQIFGGVGFTLEYDIQLYFRRAKQLQVSWWDSRTCEELIAAGVLDSPELTL